MFQRSSGSSGGVLGCMIGESITADNMHDVGGIMAEAIAASGKPRLLIEIEGFRHMEPEALMEKLKFARGHAKEHRKDGGFARKMA